MNEIPPRLDAMCIEESAETGQGEEAAQAEPDQDNVRLYEQVLKSIEDMAVHLRPLIESKHVVSPCIYFSRIERQIVVTGHTYDKFRNNYKIVHSFEGILDMLLEEIVLNLHYLFCLKSVQYQLKTASILIFF